MDIADTRLNWPRGVITCEAGKEVLLAEGWSRQREGLLPMGQARLVSFNNMS